MGADSNLCFQYTRVLSVLDERKVLLFGSPFLDRFLPRRSVKQIYIHKSFSTHPTSLPYTGFIPDCILYLSYYCESHLLPRLAWLCADFFSRFS